MGYAVVHMQKFKAGGVYGIQSHNNREHPPRTNPDIHPERTEQNYHVISCDNYASRIKQIITEQATETKTVRKDAVVYCSLIVTSDHETMAAMSEGEQKLFFNAAANWFAKRYGSENIVNATVHMDETTPHMHIGVVPVKDNRLSAKALFDKKELTALQTEFAKDVGAAYGLERGVEGSERTHLSETRFKLETAQKRLSEAEKAIEAALSTYEVKKADIEAVEGIKTTKLPGGKVIVSNNQLAELTDMSKAYIAGQEQLNAAAGALAAAESAKSKQLQILYDRMDELAKAKQITADLQETKDQYTDQIVSLQLQIQHLQSEHRVAIDKIKAAHQSDIQVLEAKVKEAQGDYNFILQARDIAQEKLKRYEGMPERDEYDKLVAKAEALEQQLTKAKADIEQANNAKTYADRKYDNFNNAVLKTVAELSDDIQDEFKRRVVERIAGREPGYIRRQHNDLER